ncbi:Patatin-like phospholipase domain-containing protein 2 [Portunus trituberculatus]|uniref:Patatin-like phospholipase domain-containing protein 2 n=1 Tax=Portunus trituberculatus TaxID=210409 RepID=A0A5B7E7L7_PORTR|nr:Patatin-like phospholipase domain-containing protein 2 [Portunus trituberculatus]
MFLNKVDADLLQKSFGHVHPASTACTRAVRKYSLQKLNVVRKSIIETAKASREYILGAFNPFFPLEEPLLRSLLELLPEDAHIRASGRLYLSLTRATTLTNEV